MRSRLGARRTSRASGSATLSSRSWRARSRQRWQIRERAKRSVLGRLTGALSYSGLGDVDLSSVASVASVDRAKPSSPTKAATKAKRVHARPKGRRRKTATRKCGDGRGRLSAARQRLASAEQDAEHARSEADQATRKVEDLTAQDQEVRERIDALESELDEAQERATRLASAVREAKRNPGGGGAGREWCRSSPRTAESAVEAAQHEVEERRRPTAATSRHRPRHSPHDS